MDYEFKDCSDAGSEYCPCHLADSGECILCSQLSGKVFCDCINWKGVCIYNEYTLNANKANKMRESCQCKIIKKELLEDNLVLFTFKVPHKLAGELVYPGSFIFLRNPKTVEYYDTPISIMEADSELNTLKVAIEKRGIKSKTLFKMEEGENISIKAPYWNGILGLKNVYNAKQGTVVVVCRGIGIAPSIPAIKKLHSNGNRIIVILDRNPFNSEFGEEYLKDYGAELYKCSTLNQGSLSEEFKKLLTNISSTESINLIHCDGPDILIYELLNFIDGGIKFSCCNNAKMCCGEGICGTCSTRYKKHVVKRLCKMQVEPKYIFKGRRLI